MFGAHSLFSWLSEKYTIQYSYFAAQLLCNDDEDTEQLSWKLKMISVRLILQYVIINNNKWNLKSSIHSIASLWFHQFLLRS